MRQTTTRRDLCGATLIAGSAMFSIACGGAQNESEPGSVASAETPVGAANPTKELQGAVAGGMDSGGNNQAASGQNTSLDGPVTTTLGEKIVGVRSENPIAHIFQEAQAGVPERLFLRHYLEMPSGQTVAFEFDYGDGSRTFPIAENGFLALTTGGRELVAKAGTVTIQPQENGRIKLSFDQIEAAPPEDVTPAPAALDAIGNGAVEGPVKRVCVRAGSFVNAEGAALPTPPAVHDAAWIKSFCGE